MITFKQYEDVVNRIAKKLKLTKDVAFATLAKAQEKCFSSGYSGCEESSRWGKPSIDTTIKYVQVLGYKYNKEQLSENEIADNRCMLIDQCISKVVSGKSDMSLEKLAQVKDIYSCY